MICHAAVNLRRGHSGRAAVPEGGRITVLEIIAIVLAPGELAFVDTYVPTFGFVSEVPLTAQ